MTLNLSPESNMRFDVRRVQLHWSIRVQHWLNLDKQGDTVSCGYKSVPKKKVLHMLLWRIFKEISLKELLILALLFFGKIEKCAYNLDSTFWNWVEAIGTLFHFEDVWHPGHVLQHTEPPVKILRSCKHFFFKPCQFLCLGSVFLFLHWTVCTILQPTFNQQCGDTQQSICDKTGLNFRRCPSTEVCIT